MTTEYTPTTQDVRVAVFQQTGDDAAFYRWLAEHDRELSERRWDEGFDAGYDAELVRAATQYPVIDQRVNPYRLEQRND